MFHGLKIYDKDFRPIMKHMYDCIEKNKLWEWLKEYNPTDGFMFSSHPNVYTISNDKNVSNDGHTGATFGVTMRMMQRIAKVGLKQFKEENTK